MTSRCSIRPRRTRDGPISHRTGLGRESFLLKTNVNERGDADEGCIKFVDFKRYVFRLCQQFPAAAEGHHSGRSAKFGNHDGSGTAGVGTAVPRRDQAALLLRYRLSRNLAEQCSVDMPPSAEAAGLRKRGSMP
jgi:hypothetical protein